MAKNWVFEFAQNQKHLEKNLISNKIISFSNSIAVRFLVILKYFFCLLKNIFSASLVKICH